MMIQRQLNISYASYTHTFNKIMLKTLYTKSVDCNGTFAVILHPLKSFTYMDCCNIFSYVSVSNAASIADK